MLNHNKPVAYLVPADLYGQMLELLEDRELVELAKTRLKEKIVQCELIEMIDNLDFVPSAQKEWKTLGSTLRNQLKNKLAESLESLHVFRRDTFVQSKLLSKTRPSWRPRRLVQFLCMVSYRYIL